MSYVERSDDELFAAWGKDLAKDPKSNEKSFVVGEILYSRTEMLEMAKMGEQPFYRVLIEMLREEAREDDCDPLDYF